MEKRQAWIDGVWVASESGRTYGVVNPATEEEIAQLPLCGRPDAVRAVEAAGRAYQTWSRLPQRERSAILKAMAEEMRGQAREIADLDVLGHGTPVRDAFRGVLAAALCIERVADAGVSVMNNLIPMRNHAPFCLRHVPLGVCALIVPWNAPFGGITTRIASCLAVGNTCVIKPPSTYPLLALKLGEVMEKAGFPAGTVNILPGGDYTLPGAIACNHTVAATSYSASWCAVPSREGTPAAVLAAGLGDRNRFIVLRDADMDVVVKRAVLASFHNSGMTNALPGRFYVDDDVCDAFTERLVAAAEQLVVGDPRDPRTQMGPLSGAGHRARVEASIRSATDHGAKLLTGGMRPADTCDRGYFLAPAVLGDVTASMTVLGEETYGPVACIMRVPSEEALLGLMKDFACGLGASVWTAEGDRAAKLCDSLQDGFVWVNDRLALSDRACGPIDDSSGELSIFCALEEYTRLDLVSMDVTESIVAKGQWNSN